MADSSSFPQASVSSSVPDTTPSFLEGADQFKPFFSGTTARNDKMAPKKLKLAPFEYKSEPNTPIYATTKLPETAPEEWYVPVTHKEKLAILTFEAIPHILKKSADDHTVTTANDSFSPRLMPLLDRMKFYFSRSMARGRCESENGQFTWPDSPSKEPKDERSKIPIYPEDVMSSVQVEAFMAGIEEIRIPNENNRLVYRRYWRILEAPAGVEQKVGGVVSSGSGLKHHVAHSVKESMEKHWDETPKVLLAEFDVGANGFTQAGRLLCEE